MDSNRIAAYTTGTLFIVATAANIAGTQLSQAVLSDPNYLGSVSVHSNQVTVGALLELIAAGACAGIAIALYPVLKRRHPGLAIGSVVFRTIEALMYTIAVVSLLSLLALSRQFTASAAADAGALRASGDLLLSLREQAIVPGVFAFSLGALMYYTALYESRLVPRWLSGWGIVAIILTLVACLLAWFNHNAMTTYTVIVLPIAVQEMVLALWLIAKGFRPERDPAPRDFESEPILRTRQLEAWRSLINGL